MPGSHGSLSKAGKVKFQQTPRMEKRKKKKGFIPKVRNRRNYVKRVIMPVVFAELQRDNVQPITRQDINFYKKMVTRRMSA